MTMPRICTGLLLPILLASCGPSGSPSSTFDPEDAKSSAPSGYKFPKAGLLALLDLSNFAKMKRDFEKVDDFSKSFDDDPLDGRKFSVVIPVSQYAGPSLGPAEWEYDAETEALTLRIQARGSMEPGVRSLEIQNTTDTGKPKKMTNAFGVEFNVEPMETWAIQLGRSDGKPIGVFSASDTFSSGFLDETLSWTTKANPQLAKSQIANLVLQIEGVVLKNESGDTVDCRDNTHVATITSPTEWTRHVCVIQVHLTRLAYQTKEGKLVKEWKANPEPTATATKRRPERKSEPNDERPPMESEDSADWALREGELEPNPGASNASASTNSVGD
jgi:hypothetical protein